MYYEKSIAILIVGVLFALLAGCAGKADTVIHMATKPMTEQYVMGYMMKYLIEQEEVFVDGKNIREFDLITLRRNIG